MELLGKMSLARRVRMHVFGRSLSVRQGRRRISSVGTKGAGGTALPCAQILAAQTYRTRVSGQADCAAHGQEKEPAFLGEAEKTYRTGQHKTCAELCSGCSSFVKGSAAETHPRRLRPKRSHPGVYSCTKAGLACILCTRTKLFFSCTPPYFPHASCHVNTFCALLAEQNALLDRGGDPHAGRVLERVCKRQEKSITD